MATVMPGLPPPRPIPIKERASILFLEKGRLDVLDGAFVVVDEAGVRIRVPRACGDEPESDRPRHPRPWRSPRLRG